MAEGALIADYQFVVGEVETLEGQRVKGQKGLVVLVCEGEAVQPRGADIPPLPLPRHRLRPIDGGEDGGFWIDLVEGGEHLFRPPVLVQPVMDNGDFSSVYFFDHLFNGLAHRLREALGVKTNQAISR